MKLILENGNVIYVNSAESQKAIMDYIQGIKKRKEREATNPNIFKKWTAQEDEFLVAQLNAGMSLEEIADALKRSKGSINMRMRTPDIYNRLSQLPWKPHNIKNGPVEEEETPHTPVTMEI